jgi:Uma2 family endonuclease
MAHIISPECDAAFRVSLDMRSVCLTDDQFYLLCRDNPELRLELSAEGELIIMPPVYTEGGWRETRVSYRLAQWTEQDGTGFCFGSSTGFRLPNGAKRSPDASWIARSRWYSLSAGQHKKFAPICPDFVVEVRSATDSLRELQKKMTEYLHNGARLGWLLDPLEKRVHIYRSGRRRVEYRDNPEYLDGEDVLPGFRFNFQEILRELMP